MAALFPCETAARGRREGRGRFWAKVSMYSTEYQGEGGGGEGNLALKEVRISQPSAPGGLSQKSCPV